MKLGKTNSKHAHTDTLTHWAKVKMPPSCCSWDCLKRNGSNVFLDNILNEVIRQKPNFLNVCFLTSSVICTQYRLHFSTYAPGDPLRKFGFDRINPFSTAH